MVPDFPKLTRHSPSYSESTDLLANFPCFFFLILMHCQPQDKGNKWFDSADVFPPCMRRGLLLEPSQSPIIDGDMRWDSGWFWGGFWVVGHLTRDVPR